LEAQGMNLLASIDAAIRVLTLVAAPVAFVIFGTVLWFRVGDGPWPLAAWIVAFPGLTAFAWLCALGAGKVSRSGILSILVRAPIYVFVVWTAAWCYIWTAPA
jgi:hypothetical protein